MFKKNLELFKKEVLEQIKLKVHYRPIKNDEIFGSNCKVEIFTEISPNKRNINIWAEVSIVDLSRKYLNPEYVSLPEHEKVGLFICIGVEPSDTEWNKFLNDIYRILKKSIKYCQKQATNILNEYKTEEKKLQERCRKEISDV